MNIFPSWKSYYYFCHYVKTVNRYMLNDSSNFFLNNILNSSNKRQKKIQKTQVFWRAQLGNDSEPFNIEGQNLGERKIPFPRERMKPLKNQAKEGRANPKGIPYLYLSTDKETAMAEVRPWVDSSISVGKLKITRSLKIIDFSLDFKNLKKFFYVKEPNPEKKELAVWTHMAHSFSTPIAFSHSNADYIPTQIIAEMFKQNGFDGLIYKSSLGEGNNIVLFDIDSAQLVDCFLYTTKKVSFEFEQEKKQISSTQLEKST